ncbi:MAG: DUF2807 domain-containing protein [Lewinellaceae bacterium]|nr:DUF2807 domain-containing protein [Lewinellaceae bacterium]
MKTNAIFQNILITTFLLSIAMVTSNCSYNGDVFGVPKDGNGNKCLAVSDAQSSRTLTIPAFDAVIVGDDWGRFAHILVEKGDVPQIQISGPENVVEVTVATVSNNVLTLSLGTCFLGSTNLTVKITTPALKQLTNRAFAADIATTGFSGDHLNIESSAYSTWNLGINYKNVRMNVTGSGKFNCSGQADKLEAYFYDASHMEAFGLETKIADITSNVQGDIDITVTDHLDARILNAGNIKYKGHPVIESAITGTGKVIDAN